MKDGTKGDVNAQVVLQAQSQAGSAERVASQGKEIISDSEGGRAEDVTPDGPQLNLEIR